MKLKQKILSLALVTAVLFGVSTSVVNAQSQWSSQNGKWYCYNNGSWAKGWAQIDGQWYYFNNNAEMHTGWLSDGGAWYYLNKSGAMHKGWLQQGQSWYYLNDDGVMINYTTVIDGKTHSFNSSGVWQGEATNNTESNASNNSEDESNIVWRAGGDGKYYHSSSECSNMKNPVKLSLKEALAKSLKKCPKCHKN